MQPVETQYLRKTKGIYPSVFKAISAEKHGLGRVCPQCSSGLRYLKDGRCVTCVRAVNRRAYATFSEERKEYHRNYSRKNPQSARRAHLKRAFDMTIEQFDSMLLDQGGKCAICRSDSPGSISWNVDHSHASGKVRGILCQPCNGVLGQAKEDTNRLLACAQYLIKHGIV